MNNEVNNNKNDNLNYQNLNVKIDELYNMNKQNLNQQDNQPNYEDDDINNDKHDSKKRKISIQKIFSLISFLFILACIIFYGTRFIKFYKESHKTIDEKFIADDIKENNKENDNFKNINNTYYFINDSENNYVKYSNLLWRIIKINENDSITLVLNNSIGILGNNEEEYKDSYINMWLNSQDKDNTGILEKNLSNVNEYLIPSNTCVDKIDNIKEITCKDIYSDSLITIPSLSDYANTGSGKSFMNNGENFYLSNINTKNRNWYIDDNGKVNNTTEDDIIGIKPVITLKRNIKLLKGNGSINEPYEFDDSQNLFGSYVKLGNDLWQVYSVDGENIKLTLSTYLKINNIELKYNYSNFGYLFDDTKFGTLAYYLNYNYLNSLPYKDIINVDEYSNGLYNTDYTKIINNKINTKVSILGIGDIFINNKSNNYFTSTGVNNSNLMYVMNNNFKATTSSSINSLSVIPVISINKSSLTTGTGSIDDPYEV